ncbi:MAG: HAD-IG family 5'-nucleotidase [Candidatus Eisenbacteria bacterium]|nr:HAD-IG family 5'-nucleotidase [Candidatus Eisenbacteria bacterium]
MEWGDDRGGGRRERCARAAPRIAGGRRRSGRAGWVVRSPTREGGSVSPTVDEPKWRPPDVDPAWRIYVNRSLRLASIRAIGFDMDHTLACYAPEPFEALAFRQAAAKLVACGYPRAIRRMRHDRGLVQRGLIVDRRCGNLLKMDRHRYVVQAFHGTRKLPREMRKARYANRRIRIGARFAAIDTFFALPEITLYAQLVDLLDRAAERPHYSRIYDDVRAAVDEAHADGSIKRAIARRPLHYLQTDPQLAATLEQLRSAGMRLFLLTNSEANYTGLIMERLLGRRISERPQWCDFFDSIVVRAGKPGFFTRRAALVPLAARALRLKGRQTCRFFTRGSVGALEAELGVSGAEVLYFGDHTYGDILKSKRSCGWRTAMIVPDLEEEIQHLEQTRQARAELAVLERRIDQLDAARDFLTRAAAGQLAPQGVRRFLRQRGLRGGSRAIPEHLAAIERQMQELAGQIRTQEAGIEARFHPHWGPLFRAGREISHFGQQVEKFACIYTSRVSNFGYYPMEKYFVASAAPMPHER